MYGLWLYKELKTEYGNCKVELYRKGYTASAVEIGALVGNSLNLALENLDTITAPIGKSVCSFEIYDTEQFEYDDLFTPDATAYKVVVSTKVDGGEYNTRWSGYVTPDFFAENLSFRTPISISARDNIGYLNDVDFDLDTATITVRELIQAAFNRIAEDYPMSLSFVTQKQTEEDILAIDATISTYLLREMSWYEALETILHDLGLQMRWVDNNTIAVLDISQLGENFGIQRFNFIESSGYREILPAWREFAQEQSYGVLDNFYKGQIDGENKLEYAANSAINTNILLYQPKAITQWSRQGEVYFLNFYNSYNAEIDDDKQDSIFITGIAPTVTNAEVLEKKMVYSQAVTEVDKQIKMTFSLNDTLRTPLASQYSRGERNTLYLPYSQSSGTTMLKTPRPYQLKFRFNIFLRANDGTNYLMREDWVEESALSEQPFIEFLTDKLQIVDTGVTDGQGNHRFAYTGYNNSKEYSITIGSIPKAGTLEFVVYPWTFEKDDYSSARDTATYQRGAKISNIVFSVQVGKTGVETKTQVGVLHNIAEKANYSFGQVPQREGDIITYAGGLFKSDTITALQGFKRNVDSTTYPLLELVGREIIHFNKKNYNKLSGTIRNLAKEPLRFDKVFIYKGKNYLPFAYSLDVISNTMNITTMQEVEPYMTHSFVEIKSELVTGGGATVSGGNNTALQYSAEVGNAKRISELNNASESEKRESYIVIDNASWNESKKVPLSEMEGLDAEQVEEYLTENKYAKQSWVKGITDDLETDIANRVLIEDFDKLQDAVDLNYANLNKATTRISTLEGYFSNGVANNAAKLGGQLPSYYATKSALDTTNTNLSNLSTTVGTIAGDLSSLTGRVSTAEDTIKGHTSSISKAVEDIATNAKNISTNAAAITTLNSKVAKLESYWDIDDNGNLHTGYNIVSDNDVIAGGEYSGGIGGGGGGNGGFGSIIIKTVSGQEYKTDSNGVVTIPDYQPKGNYLTAVPSGYAKESWVEDNYQPKGNYLTGITSTMVTTALGYVPFNSTSFTKTTIKSTLGIADWALAASKPSYSWSEITGKPTFATVATSGKYSDLSGVPTSLPASDVYAWAKKSSLAASDVPNLDWSKITSGKPTTLAGYGITDALSTSGGTITGTNIAPLSIKRNGTGGAFISFENNNGRKGYIGITNSSQLYFYSGDQVEIPSRILHEGNYSTYALPLTGGSIKSSKSATLYVDTSLETQNNIFIQCKSDAKTYIGWSSSNGSYICNYASGGRLGIKDDGTPYYNTNTLIHSGNIETQSVNKANIANSLKTKKVGEIDANTIFNTDCAVKYWPMIANSSTNIPTSTNWENSILEIGLHSYGATAQLYFSKDKPLYYRSNYDGDWNQIAYVTDNVASATKLQTARSIWGNSFDGSGDVDGNLSVKNGFKIIGASSNIFEFAASGLHIGYGLTGDNITHIYGGNGVYLRYGADRSYGLTIGSSGHTKVHKSFEVAEGLNVGKAIVVGEGLYMNNNQYMYCKDANNAYVSTLYINNSNLLAIGFGTVAKGYSTAIYGGGGVNLRYGTSGSNGLTIDSEGYTKVFKSFEVAGNTYLSADVTITGQVKASGDGVFGSDARYKSKLQDLAVDIETIANAPVFSYKWTDREDDKVHLGTTAQYWLPTKFCDAVDTSNPNFYHLNYGGLGVAIGVTVAKKVVNHEERIKELEERVKNLEIGNKQLKQWHN